MGIRKELSFQRSVLARVKSLIVDVLLRREETIPRMDWAGNGRAYQHLRFDMAITQKVELKNLIVKRQL